MSENKNVFDVFIDKIDLLAPPFDAITLIVGELCLKRIYNMALISVNNISNQSFWATSTIGAGGILNWDKIKGRTFLTAKIESNGLLDYNKIKAEYWRAGN
jgi:hypothetical protein